MKKLFALIFLLGTLFTARAQNLSSEGALERLFSGPTQEAWFDPSFLQAVPLSQLQSVIGNVQGQLGKLLRVTPLGTRNSYLLEFENGSLAANAVALNSTGQFTSLFLGPPPSSQNPTLSVEQALQRLFGEPIQADWFDPAFLKAAPIDQIRAIVAYIQERLGELVSVGPANAQGVHELEFEHGTLQLNLATVNATGQFTGLIIGAMSPKNVTLEDMREALAKLPGTTSLLILENGNPLVEVNANTPMAIGSAFKLTILDALNASIKAGQHTWDEMRTLEPRARVFSSAALDQIPDGTKLTLRQLADAMISVSDNTATDMLIDVVGRAALEERSPRNTPFLKTREAFILKVPEHADLLERFRTGDTAAKRKVLEEIQTLDLPPIESFAAALGAKPLAIESVEWFYSAHELCKALEPVADLPSVSINPGLANPSDWTRIAYKGGSESGVLNLSTRLEAAGKTYCVVTSWNNPNALLNDSDLFFIYGGILSALKSTR